MSWAWLAPGTASGSEQLQTWDAGARPHPDAVRIDASILDSRGAPCTVVWQLFAPGEAPLFDDPAVQMLTRRLGCVDLSGRLPEAVTTFTRDPVRYVGGLTVHRDARTLPELERDSWLRRVGHVRAFTVGAGILGARPTRPGPGTQRYAGQPWPATGFG